MNYRVVLSFLMSFVCVNSFASEAPRSNLLLRYTQRCFVNYSLSGHWTIDSVKCGTAKAHIEKMEQEDKCKKETIKRFQICFVGTNGAKQCAVSHQDTSCAQAIELIAKAQAVSKED